MSLRERYNDVLVRYRRAEAWYDDPTVGHEKKLRYERKLLQIICEAAALIAAIGNATGEEIREGFQREG